MKALFINPVITLIRSLCLTRDFSIDFAREGLVHTLYANGYKFLPHQYIQGSLVEFVLITS